MFTFGDSMTRLVSQLSRLPGIGPKTAQRLAMHIIQMDEAKVRDLSKAILEAKEKMKEMAWVKRIPHIWEKINKK